jgi:hypothetical protein
MRRQAADRALVAVDRVRGVLDGGGKSIAVDIPQAKRELFVRTWAMKLGKTPFGFECSDDEASYITPAKDAIFVHSVIADSLDNQTCDVFIDAFACVGGDTLAAMNQFKGSTIHSIQPSSNGNETRYKSLAGNIQVFKTITDSPGANVNAMDMGVKAFIGTLSRETQISVLYLDPPWSLDSSEQPETNAVPNGVDARDPFERYSHPVVIGHFLHVNVFNPLKAKGIFPKIVALKLPGIPRFPSIEDIMDLLDAGRYRQYALLTPRSKYAVYIFRDRSIDAEDAVAAISQTPAPPPPLQLPGS